MTAILESSHAKLSASSASRWMACPASVPRQEGLDDVTSWAAAEGTVAHEVGANVLNGAGMLDHLGKKYEVSGHQFTVDMEMLDAVDVYIQEVRRIIKEESAGGRAPPTYVEVGLNGGLQRIDLDFGGTADFVIVSIDGKIIYVIDYKHGAGNYVSAEGNKQLRYYALGALLSLPKDIKPETVVVKIVQPRCGDDPIRTEIFPAYELMGFEVDLLEAAAATRQPNPPACPGSHCKFCRALRADKCPEVEAQQTQLMAMEFDAHPSAPVVDPAKIAQALKLFPAVEQRIKDIREYAYQLAMDGKEIPGNKLVEKRAMRKWIDAETAEKEFGSREDAWTEPKLKSVAQMEKVIGKKEFKKVEERLVEKVSSGLKLVPAATAGTPVLPKPVYFDDVSL